MNRIFILIAIAALLFSCKRGDRDEISGAGKNVETKAARGLIAEGIIYDVIIKPQPENDEWETERLKGYNGNSMIDNIFEAIYNGTIEVYDYHTGEKLKPGDIRKMESREGFEREKLGKIQFTENWYFNPETFDIEKEVLSIVPGYESRSSDGTFIGYRAAFRFDLPEGTKIVIQQPL